MVKPTGESGGKGVFIGPHASEEQLEDQRGCSTEAPERWIAQQTVALSTVPTVLPDGSLAPRHVDLRPFAVYGDEIKIVPGGAHARGAARGLDDRQQLPGRRLEGHLGAGRRAAATEPAPGAGDARAAARCPACARPAGAARSSNSSRRGALMLARIAHDVYWLGRHLVRAEHTARMLDGLFHADLQGRPDDPTSVTLSWDALLAIMGAQRARRTRRRSATTSSACSRPTPTTRSRSSPASSAAREGARTLRDTISAEMWESVNTFDLQLRAADLDAGLRTGPYSIYSLVKERSALFWGLTARTMQKDEARAFLVAGGRHRGGRHGAAHAAGGAPADADARRRGRREVPRRDGNALALLRAVGGFQAFMRAAAAPPNAGPVARFMLYEREFPDSVAASVRVARTARSSGSSSTRASRRRCCACGACLPTWISGHAAPPRPERGRRPALRPVQQELERLDEEIHDRYFRAEHASSAQTVTAMSSRSATTPSTATTGPVFDQHNVAARQARRARRPARARASALTRRPERAHAHLHRLLRDRGRSSSTVAGEHERLAIDGRGAR